MEGSVAQPPSKSTNDHKLLQVIPFDKYHKHNATFIPRLTLIEVVWKTIRQKYTYVSCVDSSQQATQLILAVYQEYNLIERVGDIYSYITHSDILVDPVSLLNSIPQLQPSQTGLFCSTWYSVHEECNKSHSKNSKLNQHNLSCRICYTNYVHTCVKCSTCWWRLKWTQAHLCVTVYYDYCFYDYYSIYYGRHA